MPNQSRKTAEQIAGTASTCWSCGQYVSNDPKDPETVLLKNPVDPDEPIMHKECYWKMQDLFY